MFEKAVYRLAGDTGFLVEFGEGIAPAINARVRAMTRALENKKPQGVREIIPTYRSILVIYDPGKTCPDTLFPVIEQLETSLKTLEPERARRVEIPVCYGGDFGPDMENVQKAHDLTSDQVIQLHSHPEYLIYMVGFTPGFPFLGGLDKRLFTPRLETPRMLVPEGSVGIANNQTGMYPIASPGGWQLIGRTPLKLFAPDRTAPFLYKAGDRIKFIPISEQQFSRIARQEEDR
ncbi:MAG: 5-oxoprolinase subunit PxpB [Proteobacteria bacterium]|nr:5-oxoprolinase subunit PxpB [Pseudomonadota bacterium]